MKATASWIECIADCIMMLKKGTLIDVGTTEEILMSMEGKVGKISCEYNELSLLQQKYKAGNVNRTKDGFVLRIVGDELPKEAVLEENDINLEDVYLYYLA